MTGFATLRDSLRAASDRSHAALDAAMGPLALGEDLPRFLRVQYLARRPIEAWLARAAPEGWEPPVQTPLIARDLGSLGVEIPDVRARFAAPREGFLGVAWAIAGSSLGNRAIAVRRRKAGLAGAEHFLCDDAMPAYWQRLLPRLEQCGDPGEARAGSDAAAAVFALFAHHAAPDGLDLAA